MSIEKSMLINKYLRSVKHDFEKDGILTNSEVKIIESSVGYNLFCINHFSKIIFNSYVEILKRLVGL